MQKVPPKPRLPKVLSKEELLNVDKNALIDRIIQLEAHNTQLKNIISKSVSKNSDTLNVNTNIRKYDFKQCHYRRVMLHILYFGWDYQGLAVQEDNNETIEHYLFNALIKSCLIESRETSQYHRCGRTDKGVSAFGQVISITLRSHHSPMKQMMPNSVYTELLYCKVLNRLLPQEIRVVAWMPISEDRPDFSARFDCKKRQYKYYFPKSCLNIDAMRDACSRIIGSHDFRHFCKMDVGNGITEFIREITRADILPVDGDDSPTSMFVLIIEGNAFLWHQIRCIMGILLLVGEGGESSSIMTDLLDVQTNPRKPQYNMALHLPLNLFKCSYDVEDEWYYDQEELKVVISHVQRMWTVHNVKATMIKDCLRQLETTYRSLCSKSEPTDGVVNKCEEDNIATYTDCLLQGVKPKVYTPLLKRDTCSSLEERIEHYKKKRKIGEPEEKMEES